MSPAYHRMTPRQSRSKPPNGSCRLLIPHPIGSIEQATRLVVRAMHHRVTSRDPPISDGVDSRVPDTEVYGGDNGNRDGDALDYSDSFPAQSSSLSDSLLAVLSAGGSTVVSSSSSSAGVASSPPNLFPSSCPGSASPSAPDLASSSSLSLASSSSRFLSSSLTLFSSSLFNLASRPSSVSRSTCALTVNSISGSPPSMSGSVLSVGHATTLPSSGAST